MSYNWSQTIKKIAKEERSASKPVKVVIGKVISGSPLRIRVSEKLYLDDDFLLITKTAKDSSLKEGSDVLMLRKSGGQEYVVIDKVVK